MNRLLQCYTIIFIALMTFPTNSLAQHKQLRLDIEKIIDGKQATVGVALMLDGRDSLTINNQHHYPMQSVYKFHLALAVLDYMHKNDLSLEKKIFVKKSDLLPDTYSPLRDKHPNGEFEISIGELLKYTVSQSDNNTCDILFRLVGGPNYVNRYIKSLGIGNISIIATEEEMHKGWDIQFLNWSTPYAAIRLLEKFKHEDILPTEYESFLWRALADTSTGSNKIKGLLPAGTIVGHKTGISGRNAEGVRAADNDIGVVTLPNGRYYSIAVFVAASKENDDTNARIIAEISKTVYDYLLVKAVKK